jgi:hypothetical protein
MLIGGVNVDKILFISIFSLENIIGTNKSTGDRIDYKLPAGARKRGGVDMDQMDFHGYPCFPFDPCSIS